MKPLCLVTSLLFVLSVPAMAQAQTPPTGTWTGSSTTPAGEEVKLSIDVSISGDSTHVVINTIEHGSFTLSEIRVANDTLSFKFQPGPLVECVLPKQADGSYSGACSSGQTGETATMVMIPPRKE